MGRVCLRGPNNRLGWKMSTEANPIAMTASSISPIVSRPLPGASLAPPRPAPPLPPDGGGREPDEPGSGFGWPRFGGGPPCLGSFSVSKPMVRFLSNGEEDGSRVRDRLGSSPPSTQEETYFASRRAFASQ